MSNVWIREITEADFSICATLYTEVFGNFPWNERWNEETALARILHFYRSPLFIGCVIGNEEEILGYLYGNIQPYEDYMVFSLEELAIKQNEQGKQLGTKLMQHLENTLQEREVSHLWLISKSETPAESFYKSLGMATSEESIFMEKKISHF